MISEDDFEGALAIIWLIIILGWASWEWDFFKSGQIHTMTWKTQTSTETFIVNYRPQLEFEIDEARDQVFQQITFPVRGLSADIISKVQDANLIDLDRFVIRQGDSAEKDTEIENIRLTDREKGLLEFDRKLIPLENTVRPLNNCVIRSVDTWRCDSAWGESLLNEPTGNTAPYIGMIDGAWIMNPDIRDKMYTWKIGLLFERIVKHGDVVIGRTIADQEKLERELLESLRRRNNPPNN